MSSGEETTHGLLSLFPFDWVRVIFGRQDWLQAALRGKKTYFQGHSPKGNYSSPHGRGVAGAVLGNRRRSRIWLCNFTGDSTFPGTDQPHSHTDISTVQPNLRDDQSLENPPGVFPGWYVKTMVFFSEGVIKMGRTSPMDYGSFLATKYVISQKTIMISESWHHVPNWVPICLISLSTLRDCWLEEIDKFFNARQHDIPIILTGRK